MGKWTKISNKVSNEVYNPCVIGGVPEGSRRDHNIVRVSSFARKELSWHKRSGIVLVVLVWCDVE